MYNLGVVLLCIVEKKMFRMLFLVLLGVICCFTYIESLDCGVLDQAAEVQFQDAMRKCAPKSSEEEDSGESSEHSKSGVKRTVNKSNTDDSSIHEESGKLQNKNNTDDTGNCSLQCIYANLNMTDGNGYPTVQQLMEILPKYAKNKEAKDFFEDSIQDCFQLIKQGGKMDSCEYSNQLTTCLTEKGKANCNNWDNTYLPLN